VGPHPAVAAIRHAVRASLAASMPGDVVLAACSGGADSLALAAALAFEAPKAGILAGGITIDHGLQAGSAAQADRVCTVMTALGLVPAVSVRVDVAGAGSGDGYQGPEAAARTARYAALAAAAESAEHDRAGGAWIMLGHTLDDQAETVLLGLARGSGARSLAGMAPVTGRYLRPLLRIRREQTVAACAALGLETWSDPQNCDPAFTRTRVRRELLPVLAEVLGPGADVALARTADLLRADADALDAIAAAEAARLGGDGALLAEGWSAEALSALSDAIRHRVLRRAALAAGCPAGALSQRHVDSLDALVTGWHGQRWADLPGGIRGLRRYGRLLFTGEGRPGVASQARTAARSEDPGGRE
jgi:tRNA(Ile)-lysidine synthase